LNETPFIASLDKRIAELMQVPVVNGEGLQILNYQIGGEYKPHFDYFPPELPGSAVHIARGGQRIATLIVYLNTVEEGGETILPEIGLKVAPVQGNALYFAYTNSLNQVDPLTYHGGNPVIRGEKWIATKWVRQHEYR
jgi:prolyl 4-hydroxylase